MATRRHFHEELHSLERELIAEGELALEILDLAMEALQKGDPDLADEVIAKDDLIDERYLAVERGTVELMALQTPVASDLRLIFALIHSNFHLERVGDMAVNIAKAIKLTVDLPRNAVILEHIGEMGALAQRMIRQAITAFAERDLSKALALPRMDDPIDRLNRHTVQEVLACHGDEAMLEWALRMMLVSRQLERVGDHAVDIGEQVAFLLTGEFREFTDATHGENPPDPSER